jgi:hypothetical protein
LDEKLSTLFALCDSLSLLKIEQGHNNLQAMFLELASGLHAKSMASSSGTVFAAAL